MKSSSNYFAILFIIVSLTLSLQSYAQISIPLQNELNRKDLVQRAYDILISGDAQELRSYCDQNKILIKYQTPSWLALHIKGDQLSKLLKQSFLEKIYWSNDLGTLLNDKVIGNANVIGLQEIGIYDSLLNGNGVILGFIDSGMDYSHPDFIDEDGSSRILYFWDQKNPADSSEIFQDYGYGRLISQDTLNQWIDSDAQVVLDPNSWYGHGTTVVGTACSNGRALVEQVEEGSMDVDYHGIAPKSSIIMVASDFDRPDWLMTVADGVQFMLSKADELNMPIVINLSIGTYSGSHDALDPVGSMINDWFSDEYPGRSLVCAGGNSRSLRYHLGFTSNSDTTMSLFSSFNGPADLGRVSYFEAWLDSVETSTFKASIGIYDHSLSELVEMESNFRGIDENIGSILTDSLYSIDSTFLGFCQRYMSYQGEQIQLQVQVDQLASSNYSVVLYTSGSGRIDSWSADWLGTSNIIGPENLPLSITENNYRAPDSLMQIVSSFSCAENALMVANYKNRLNYLDVNNNLISFEGNLGELSENSSRGPTRDGRIKPDLAASGELVLSAGPFNYLSVLSSAAPYKMAQGGWHMRNGGTSMASPIVAGIAALYLQRCPYALPSQVKEAILSTSYQDIYSGILPNTSWGNGKVNGLAALQSSKIPIIIEENIPDCIEGIVNLSIDASYSDILWNTGESSESICVEAGDYWLRAIDEAGCLQYSSIYSVSANGIIENKRIEIELFPNPSSGKFILKGFDSKSHFMIINILGQQQAFLKKYDNEEWQLEMINSKSGIYYLIEAGSGKSIELIINK